MGLNVGDKIPETLSVDQNGKQVKRDDFKGKKLILYFYPKDNTPGCTAEACNFRDNFHLLYKEGYQVVGVSIDDEASHTKFIEKHELPFNLISDKDKELVEVFGIWGEKTLAGKKYFGTYRTTYVVDEEGTIQKIFTYKDIKAKDHADQIVDWITEEKKKKKINH